MAVNTPDALYEENIQVWSQIRDCVLGERRIKNEGVKYLRPIYPNMNIDNPDKWRHFLRSAKFTNVTARLHSTLSGSMLRQEPAIELPESIREDFIKSFGINNSGIQAFIADVIGEETITGRTGILVDRATDGEGLPYPIIYRAEDIIGTQEEIRNGAPFFTNIRLSETYTELNETFDETTKQRIRELGIDEDGSYFQRIWEGDDENKNFGVVLTPDTDEEGRVYPQLGGSSMERIPFWLAGGCYDDCRPILADVSGLNIHLYNKESYASWAYYLYSSVTFFVSGVSEDESAQFSLGEVWSASNPDAKANVVAGQADIMRENREAVSQDLDTMASMGASFFERSTGSSESAAALRIRYAPQGAVVGMIANACSATLSEVLQFAVEWETGVQDNTVAIEIFPITVPRTIDPSELTAVMNGVIQGVMPIDILWHVLDTSELLPRNFDAVEATDFATNAEPSVPEQEQ